MLTISILAGLRSLEGAELLARAAELVADPFAVEKLRKRWPAPLAAAAIEQCQLRRRAASRFSRAEEMWFTRPLLEQASGELAATQHAKRFDPAGPVADLCCGLGGDA